MKLTKTISSVIFQKYYSLFPTFTHRNITIYTKYGSIHPFYKLHTPNILQMKKFIHSEENNEEDEISQGINNIYTELYQQPVTDILQENGDDYLIKLLYECLSLQDVLNFIKHHQYELETKHITHLVLVLCNMQKMFHHVNMSRSISYIDIAKVDNLNKDYINLLKKDEIYDNLVKLLCKNRGAFDTKQLSYILFYLNKIGINSKDELMQNLVLDFQDKSKGEYSLPVLLRFMTAILDKRDFLFYYNVKEFIPTILNNIETCDTIEDFNILTLCLNKIHGIITGDRLNLYKKKVIELMGSNVINVDEYQAILNIMMFLHFPHWRDKNVKLITQCLELLRVNLHLLNVDELLSVYEVFCKIQEPGDMLNEIQRHATKYLRQLEEDMSPLLNIRLKLLSCMVYFSPPVQRPNFKKIIETYIDYDLDATSLLELNKIMTFTKIADKNICNKYWKKILLCLKDESFTNKHLLQVCHNYISFNVDIRDCRCLEFERKMVKMLEHELKFGLLGLLPGRFSLISSFLLIYSKNYETLQIITRRISEFVDYFNMIDCLNLSKSLQINYNQRKKFLTYNQIINIKSSIDQSTYKILSKENYGLNKTNMLLKGYIYRNSSDQYLLDNLWRTFKEKLNLYSPKLRATSFNLIATNTLHPMIINNLVNYVVESKTNMLSFNAERILYLCYYLGYLPENHEEFFKSITDTFLRDQERMSGLSYLEASLSLCFFNVLPESFIKQIFNVEFLEKLDFELAHCYYKDVYPLRVRYYMMQLNRAVCLDYPQLNVPWFHQKYITKEQQKGLRLTEMDYLISHSIKEHLLKVFEENSIKENQYSHYGYHIDFVIDDSSNNVLENNIPRQKMAILITKPDYFTKRVKQLKGYYQLKMRHLEIMGYKVCQLDLDKWQESTLEEEKIDYIKNSIKVK